MKMARPAPDSELKRVRCGTSEQSVRCEGTRCGIFVLARLAVTA